VSVYPDEVRGVIRIRWCPGRRWTYRL